MRFYILTIKDNGDFANIVEWNDDECMIKKSRYNELLNTERRYKEHLNTLKDHTLVEDDTLKHLHEVDKKYNETRYEYCKLKVRYMQENLFKYHGDPIDWAVYHITRFLNDYLKERGIDDSTSLTEKRMITIGFAHRVEEGLLDYIEKLEEFNK